MSSIPGPLGILPGLTYDPVTNRYFATPKVQQQPVARSSRGASRAGSEDGSSSSIRGKGKGRMLPPTICVDDRGEKRIKLDPEDERTGRRRVWREPRMGVVTNRRAKVQQRWAIRGRLVQGR